MNGNKFIIGFIYKITNILNNKIYFGLAISSKNLEARKYMHFKRIKSSGQHIDNAIRKYGAHNFKWEVFTDTCSSFEELKEAEKLCIELYQTNCRRYGKFYGYNETDGGDGYSGPKTEEHKKKLSYALQGEKNPNYGKSKSIETKIKMSKSHNPKLSNEFGRKNTNETKIKMREAQKGEKGYWYGKKLSEETKKKMSEAQKLRQELKRKPGDWK